MILTVWFFVLLPHTDTRFPFEKAFPAMKITTREIRAAWRRLIDRGKVRIGADPRIARGVRFNVKCGGTITLGARCRLHAGSILAPSGGYIELGDDCSLNPYSILYGHGGLKIGNGVRIAAHTVIIPSNHGFDDLTQPIFQQRSGGKGVVIEDDVWIGANCTILDGVRIAKGCVIGAGSVVSKSTEPLGIYGGVPARLIKTRGTAALSRSL
jgi:acetyltransferase-like isoleucine patch superfamily enzyme